MAKTAKIKTAQRNHEWLKSKKLYIENQLFSEKTEISCLLE